MPPTSSQAHALALLERIEGCVSLVAVCFIFIAYGLVPRLRNPRNTFIIMASIANVGASIACIIARDGLAAGEDSALCRAQAFLLQMFMQSDAWWALGMSFNTLLVVLGRTKPNVFHAWQYCLVCFGGPFTIAFVLLFISTPARGPIYGEAYIWCSVSDRWPNVRVFASYVFVWPCIVGSVILNSIVGYRIFHSRNRIRNLSNSMDSTKTTTRSNDNSTVTPVVIADFLFTRRPSVNPLTMNMPTHVEPTLGVLEASLLNTPQQYLSTISSPTSNISHLPKHRLQRSVLATRRVISRYRLEDPVKRVYLRATFLFTFSIVVSWMPATVNRFHSFVHGSSSFPYQIATVSLLPLQGVWNAIIFFVTSHKIMQDWAQDQREMRCGRTASAASEPSRNSPSRVLPMNEFPNNTDTEGDVELGSVGES